MLALDKQLAEQEAAAAQQQHEEGASPDGEQAAAQPPQQQGGNAALASGSAQSHPDLVVAVIKDLAEPLSIADMAFRQAGNHTGLDEIDSAIKDILDVVTIATDMRGVVHDDKVTDIRRGLDDHAQAEEGGAGLDAVRLRAMDAHLAGMLSCVHASAASARHLFALVPLVLPTEMSSRNLKKTVAWGEALEPQVDELRQRVAHELDRVKGDVSTALTSQEALMESLEPSYTKLEVTLRAAAPTVGSGGTGAISRPASPSRLRGTRRAGAAPPSFALQVSLPAPAQDQERYEQLCTEVSSSVLGQPTVRALLAPYHALLDATNHVAFAVHAAAAAEPTEADIESLLNPGSLAAAKTLNHTSGDQFVTSTNVLQLKRWGAAVANISASTSLVMRGFIEATDRCNELAPLECLWIKA